MAKIGQSTSKNPLGSLVYLWQKYGCPFLTCLECNRANRSLFYLFFIEKYNCDLICKYIMLFLQLNAFKGRAQGF